jgi:hypothetical protein
VAALDSTELLAEIRRRCAAPVSSSSAPGFQDADLLAYANGVIPGIQDKLRRVRTNYFTTQKDVPFIQGTAAYRIPNRAQHGLISLVQRLTTTGDLKHLTKWTEKDMADRNPTQQGTPTNYLWRGSSLVLWPVPDNSSESLRFTFHRECNKLVAPSVVGVVSNISNVTDPTILSISMTATAASLGITTSTPLDFIRAALPFDSLGDDYTPSAVAGSAVQVNAATSVRAALAVGDYVCLAGQAPVVQMPKQAFYVVAQAVACALLSEDAGALPAAQRLLAMLEADLYGGANDRDDGEPDSAACDTWA